MGVAELTRNAVHVLPEGGLEQKLKLGRPLRVKLGIDVTAPDVTLGNGVPLQRMRAFQDEGHVGVLIVGDYTTRIGERDDFAKRFAANAPISVSELLYPLMQAYDSVAVQADVELGGSDQLFNLLAGRDVMDAYGLDPQVAFTTAYLDSWDGTGMSGSRGNYIGLKEAPEEQFGKAMRIPDSLLDQWYRLVMQRDGAPAGDPLEAKLELARFIVRRAWGE